MPHKRFLLWIDGVGGYLVCLGTRVSLGQATSRAGAVSAPPLTGPGQVDIPLYADVSRLHAELSRDEEGYVLETARTASVNGEATSRATLRPGDRVTLGATCQFVFSVPVPISPTARLDLVSGHRLPLAVDGVLLMAETLILGPTPPAHILMADAASNLIFYRSKEGLGMRHSGRFCIDDEPHEGRATLPIPCHVRADSFSFALEDVPAR